MTINERDCWGEGYLRYWEEATGQGSSVIALQPPDLTVVRRYLARLELGPGQRLLEVGIGFGRLVPALAPFGCEIWGIDLSREMIEAARERFGSQCADLRVGAAEALPYRDGSFDRVICWGTFDALHQEVALAEITRVLRLEGRLLLSGKNDDYHDDDEEAFNAELKAGVKGFPNRFTTFSAFEVLLPQLGLRLTEVHYFERRGDLALDRGSPARPSRFYEYVLVAEKEEALASPPSENAIAKVMSQTFIRRARLRPLLR